MMPAAWRLGIHRAYLSFSSIFEACSLHVFLPAPGRSAVLTLMWLTCCLLLHMAVRRSLHAARLKAAPLGRLLLVITSLASPLRVGWLRLGP